MSIWRRHQKNGDQKSNRVQTSNSTITLRNRDQLSNRRKEGREEGRNEGRNERRKAGTKARNKMKEGMKE